MGASEHANGDTKTTRITRREALRLLGFTGSLPLLATLLDACGGASPATTVATAAATSAALANTPVTAGGTPLTTFITPVPVASAAASAAASPSATRQAGTSATGAPTGGSGTLKLATATEPDALDPAKTIQAAADSFNDNLYDRLVYIGRDRLPHPWIAEKWDIAAEGKEITFAIRKGVKFHDGTDLDAAAVKFTFDRILDPATASPAKAQMGTLQSVDLVDGTSVRFTFSAPYAPFFTNISLGYGGIVSPSAVKQAGADFGHKPVGSGPFKLKEWVTGQRLVLERNADWKNFRTDADNTGPAYLAQLEFRVIADAATRLAALQSGELDVSDVDVQQVDTIKGDPKYQVIIWKEATDHNFIEYANKAPFTDLAVRQAIAYSIDRDSIVKSAWNGYATANLSPQPVGVAGWDQGLGQQYGYPFDLDKAKKVLADGGYTPGPDGVLQKDGKPLAFTLLLYSGSEPGKTATQIIQATLQTIGMKVEIQIIEFGSELPLLKAGKFDADWMRWTWPDPVIESLLFKTPGWTNQLSDPELDKLCAVADTTLDPTQRVVANQAVQKYILQKAYIAPIATDWIVRAARANVKGYAWDAIGYPQYFNIALAK
jgi:peptide/nickel transport system substrate-binding protein